MEEFCDGIASSRARFDDNYQTSDFSSLKSKAGDVHGVVDVVIAKNFNHLDDYFQLQAVEVGTSSCIYGWMLTESVDALQKDNYWK